MIGLVNARKVTAQQKSKAAAEAYLGIPPTMTVIRFDGASFKTIALHIAPRSEEVERSAHLLPTDQWGEERAGNQVVASLACFDPSSR